MFASSGICRSALMWSISSLWVLRTSLVMSASHPSTCGERGGGYLHDALFGSAIASRGKGDDAVGRLDAILKGLPSVLTRELGDREATSQAILELNRVIDLPTDTAIAVHAKRAAVLFALWRERDVQQHFRQRGEAELVDDLCGRVLPLVMPRFVANQCQVPDAAVVMASVLHSMWSAEDIAAVEAHLERSAGEDDDRGDREGG